MKKLPVALTALVAAILLIAAASYVSNGPVRAESSADSATPAPIISKKEKHKKNIDEFFSDNGPIPELKFEFKPREWEYLNRDNRRYVECTMIEVGGKTYPDTAVKLKGSAGSFRGPNDKPGLTVSMDKFKKAERYRGQEKFHLNNCAQDGTALMEVISGEIARKAGVPASRCSHAFVTFNGKDFGLYVFKEGFTKEFLAEFYSDTSGNLYDGGFVREIDINTEQDKGDPEDRSDLKALLDAVAIKDQKERWEALEKIVDIDKFLSFYALEAILCHWDGYNFNRNNYRFYFDPSTRKFSFFLHGMDQTLGDSNFPVFRDPGAMVGQHVFSNPVWRERYNERVREIYENVLKPIDWPGRVVQIGNRVKAALEKKNPQLAKDYEGRINEARDRVANRIAAIGKQLESVPVPIKFDGNGIANLEPKGWRQEGNATFGETVHDGKKCLRIAGNDAAGSWRKTLALPPGKYRFEATVLTKGVEARSDEMGEGAGIRISGGRRQEQNALKGDTPWQKIAFEFEAPGNEIVLIAELRAHKGEALFDQQSLRIVRLP